MYHFGHILSYATSKPVIGIFYNLVKNPPSLQSDRFIKKKILHWKPTHFLHCYSTNNNKSNTPPIMSFSSGKFFNLGSYPSKHLFKQESAFSDHASSDPVCLHHVFGSISGQPKIFDSHD